MYIRYKKTGKPQDFDHKKAPLGGAKSIKEKIY
jgi:hypothetical protein